MVSQWHFFAIWNSYSFYLIVSSLNFFSLFILLNSVSVPLWYRVRSFLFLLQLLIRTHTVSLKEFQCVEMSGSISVCVVCSKHAISSNHSLITQKKNKKKKNTKDIQTAIIVSDDELEKWMKRTERRGNEIAERTKETSVQTQITR